MPTATESDDELLASLEPGSFAVFYRRHVEDLVAFFMRRTRDAELAADLTAETFAAALVARARFDPGRGSASGWLFGIALNKLARVERREAAERRARRRLGMEWIELTDADIERIDALGSGERARLLLERFSPEQRDAIRAHVIDEPAVRRDRALAGDLRGGRAQARQPRPGRRPPANGTTRMSDDFFIRLERQLQAAELRELNRAPVLRRIVSPRRLLAVPLAAAAAVGVVVVILAVLGAIDKNDADRRPQPVGTVPAPGARELITETANNWVRLFASSAQACNEYTGRTVCEQVKRDCQRKGVTRIEDCRRATRGWAAEHRGATVQRIAISGDRAAATFSNHGQELETVQLRRTATGEWLIDKLGPIGAVGSSK